MKTTPDTRPLAERITQRLDEYLDYNDKACLSRGIAYSPGWIEGAFDGDPEAEANVEFIYEAFTVCHETGRTPRQLADERAELISTLSHVWERASDHEALNFYECNTIHELLTRLQS